MPKLSFKAHDMPSSPIRKLAPYAEAAKKEGKHVIHLNIGQPDIEMPEVAIKAIQETDIKVLQYAPSDGFASYKEGLVNYYKDNDINISSDNIKIGRASCRERR